MRAAIQFHLVIDVRQHWGKVIGFDSRYFQALVGTMGKGENVAFGRHGFLKTKWRKATWSAPDVLIGSTIVQSLRHRLIKPEDGLPDS